MNYVASVTGANQDNKNMLFMTMTYLSPGLCVCVGVKSSVVFVVVVCLQWKGVEGIFSFLLFSDTKFYCCFVMNY